MPNYEKMYFHLAAKVADAVDILVEAQRQGEADYVESEALILSLKDIQSNAKDQEKVEDI